MTAPHLSSNMKGSKAVHVTFEIQYLGLSHIVLIIRLWPCLLAQSIDAYGCPLSSAKMFHYLSVFILQPGSYKPYWVYRQMKNLLVLRTSLNLRNNTYYAPTQISRDMQLFVALHGAVYFLWWAWKFPSCICIADHLYSETCVGVSWANDDFSRNQ